MDPMNGDNLLDRELERALAVDPSPEFLARVRTRVAGEPEPAASWWSWKLLTAGALVAGVAIAIVGSRPREARPEHAQVAPVGPMSAPALPVGRAARGSTDSLQVGTRRASVARAEIVHSPLAQGPSRGERLGSEPEVLFDTREALAIRAMIDGVREDRLDLAPLLQPPPPPVMDPDPVDAIRITLIAFDLLNANPKGVPQ